MAYDRFAAINENNEFPPEIEVVNRTGDTMTGDLTIGAPSDTGDPKGLYLRSGGIDPTNGVRLVPYNDIWGEGLWVQDLDAGGNPVGISNLIIADPTTPQTAATKGYVDGSSSLGTGQYGFSAQIRKAYRHGRMVTINVAVTNNAAITASSDGYGVLSWAPQPQALPEAEIKCAGVVLVGTAAHPAYVALGTDGMLSFYPTEGLSIPMGSVWAVAFTYYGVNQ